MGFGLFYVLAKGFSVSESLLSSISNCNTPAVKQCGIQLTAVTDICCSRGRWRRGLGSSRSAVHCTGERKSLLIMSAGTDALLGLTPPHTPPRCLARRNGMTALTHEDSLSHRGAAFPRSSPSINLQISMWGAHSSAWPSEIRDSISFVRSFWQAPTEVNDYTESQLFFC